MNEHYLVIGDGGANSLGIIRSLGENGYSPDAIIMHESKKKLSLIKSKYLKECCIVPKDEEKIVDTLIKFAENKDKVFLIPTSDYVVGIIDDNSEKLKNKYVLPHIKNEIGKLKNIMSKENMVKFAEEAGFCVPKSKKYHIAKEEKTDLIIDEYFHSNYPLIIKPDSIFSADCGFKIVKNINELSDCLSENEDRIVLVQEYIENSDEISIQGIGFGEHQNPGIFGAVKKIRTSVFAMGTTTYARIEKITDLRLNNLVKSFINLIGYSGIFDIELLLRGEDIFFIECNFRNGSYGYAYTAAGANLPVLWIEGMKACSGCFDAEKTRPIKELTFVNDIGDLAHLLKHDIGFIKWMYQYLTADVHLTFNFKDQGPFWAEIDLKRLIKKVL